MSTFDKIDTLLKEQNKKQVDLCNYIGIGKNRYTDWKAGRVKSYVKYLPKIAEFLNVTIDYLLSDNEKKPINVDEPEQERISPEKKILLSAFDKASDDDRRVLWTLLDKYMTPNEKQYFSQSEQQNDVG